MLHALGGDLLQTFLDLAIERRAHFHIKSAPDERQPQRLGGQLSQLHADAAQDTFARFKDDSAGLELLFKLATFAAKPAGVRAIDLGVMLEHAVPARMTVTMQTAGRLCGRLVPVVAGATVAR